MSKEGVSKSMMRFKRKFEGFYTFCLLLHFSSSDEVCLPPHVPYGGNYEPMKSSYHADDIVVYHCQKGYFAAKEHPRSTCQESGYWSMEGIAFCDGPSLKPDFEELLDDQASEVTKATDGDVNTCQSLRNSPMTWKAVMSDVYNITAVRFYGLKGHFYTLEVFVQQGRLVENRTSCGQQNRTLKRNGWINFRCPEHTAGDQVYVKEGRAKGRNLQLCEVEIIPKDRTTCQPPQEVYENGYLVYKRNTATLTCLKGYKKVTNREITCRDSLWPTPFPLCEKEDTETDSESGVSPLMIGVITVLAVIVLGLFVTCWCVRKWMKSKRVEIVPSGVFATRTTKSFVHPQRPFTSEHMGPVSVISATLQDTDKEDDPENHVYSEVRYSAYLERVQLPTRAYGFPSNQQVPRVVYENWQG